MNLYNKMTSPSLEYRVNNLKWCILRYPNDSMVQLAGMEMITYLCTTLFAADRRSRLTLDRELILTEDGHSMRFPRLAIIETKSGSAPSSADRIL